MTPDEIRTAIAYTQNLLKHLTAVNASESMLSKTRQLLVELRLQLELL